MNEYKKSFEDLENENEDHKKRLEELTIEVEDVNKIKEELSQLKKSIELGELVALNPKTINLKVSGLLQQYNLIKNGEKMNIESFQALVLTMDNENNHMQSSISELEKEK